MKKLLFFAIVLGMAFHAQAQMYTGMSGLLHVPSAEMSSNASMRIGSHYVNPNFVPKGYNDSYCQTFYISLTPYNWVEASYTILMWNRNNVYLPDRSLSIKIRPLKEGKWWPAVAIGSFDPFGTELNTNYYIAATKHFEMLGGEWGFNVAFRHYKKVASASWNGFIGGISYRPDFYRGLRGIIEYDGKELNIGVDVNFLRILRAQVILQDWRYFTLGICFDIKKL